MIKLGIPTGYNPTGYIPTAIGYIPTGYIPAGYTLLDNPTGYPYQITLLLTTFFEPIVGTLMYPLYCSLNLQENLKVNTYLYGKAKMP